MRYQWRMAVGLESNGIEVKEGAKWTNIGSIRWDCKWASSLAFCLPQTAKLGVEITGNYQNVR